MNSGRKTERRIFVPRVILVGLTDAQVARCREALSSMKIEPLKVGPPGAQERIATLMPVAVVIDEKLDHMWGDIVAEAAAAVGAELVTMNAVEPDEAMLAWTFSMAIDRER